MKLTCDFCKTEYCTDVHPNSSVRCAICGHTWIVPPQTRKNSLLVFIAALCALLAATVFSVVVIAHHQASTEKNKPLVAAVTKVDSVVDAAGVSHFVVSGYVLNQSTEIYGVPDLLIVSLGDDGRVISQQKFMPSATLLDSGARVEFKHTLTAPTTGVKKITAKLDGVGDDI